MTASEDAPSTVDGVLLACYHACAGADGRADLKKVLDDADAYCDAHPEVFRRDRRKLLHARLRVVDRNLRISIGATQAALFDEPRYYAVGDNLRVEAKAMQITDWDACYGLELDEYLLRVSAHQVATKRYRDIRNEWRPGDRLPEVLERLRAKDL